MKIFVTGASGYIGSAIATVLVSRVRQVNLAIVGGILVVIALSFAIFKTQLLTFTRVRPSKIRG
jgi:nucleoside-diphosphate-sugar epimerase